MTLARLLLTALLLALPAAAQAQDLEAGQRSFAKCRACHQVGEGAKNLVGPPSVPLTTNSWPCK